MNGQNMMRVAAAVWFGSVAASHARSQQGPDSSSLRIAASRNDMRQPHDFARASEGKSLPHSHSIAKAYQKHRGGKLTASLLRDFVTDQRDLWTSPAQLRTQNANWLLPLAGFTAGLIAADRGINASVSNSTYRVQHSRDFSNVGVASLLGVGGGLYVLGHFTQDEHKRETGRLSGEAVLNSFVITSALKNLAGRERPQLHHSAGNFRRGGSSFPSEHAAAAWAVAGILAHEYPGPLSKFFSYGMATAISVSRVTGKEHFPSDVLVGGAIGYLAAWQAYRAHHNPELRGTPWDESSDAPPEAQQNRSRPGATFVALDSWVYPAFERLNGLGYAPSGLAGMKPWTRMECARLTDEVGDRLKQLVSRDDRVDELSTALHAALQREFAFELRVLDGDPNKSFGLETAYARVTSISGAPLTDGFHFGQTLSYDSGRPFRRGTNAIAGSAVRGTLGPFYFYASGEFQHSPSAPPLSNAAVAIIALRDGRTPNSPHLFAPINQGRLLDTYVGINFRDWQLTFGKQSLSWGPGAGGGLLWSQNAEPLNMLRVTRVLPLELPSIFHLLGPMRLDQFIGQPEGRSFIPDPYIYGQKISFKPNRYLELGFSRTVTLGGKGGDPFTARNFYRTFFGRQGKLPGPGLPGDSRSSVDWTFLVPGLHHFVVLYADMFSDDDPLPWVHPSRSTFRPGVHLTHVPGLPRLDFRVEATSSESPGARNNHGNLNYFNALYRDGYTNDSFLIGNTVGRQGRVIQVWSTYWLSARNSLQFSFKNNSVSPDFIPGGGVWQDYSVRHEISLKAGVFVRSLLQFEHIAQYPVLFLGKTNNFTASLQLGVSPEKLRW